MHHNLKLFYIVLISSVAVVQELQQIVQECFNWCSTLELYDVAFPFLGVEKMLSYPAETVARILISESISRVEEGCDWKVSISALGDSHPKPL